MDGRLFQVDIPDRAGRQASRVWRTIEDYDTRMSLDGRLRMGMFPDSLSLLDKHESVRDDDLTLHVDVDVDWIRQVIVRFHRRESQALPWQAASG
jgi:hypothetical protein